MRIIKVIGALLFLVTILACGGSGGGGLELGYSPLDFDVTPVESVIGTGQTATLGIHINSKHDINSKVTMSVSGLPTGVTVTYNPTQVLADTVSDASIAILDNTAPEGAYTVTVRLTEEDGTTYLDRIVLLTISNSVGPSFSLEVAPAQKLDFTPGETKSCSFFVRAVNGYTGTVQVSLSGATDDFQFSNLTPMSVTIPPNQGGTFLIHYTPTPPIGQGVYITVTATDGIITKTGTVYCRSDGMG